MAHRLPAELLRRGVPAIALGSIGCTSSGTTTPTPSVTSVAVVPATTISLGSTIYPEGAALDANGNLYIGAFSQLLMFTPPFTSSSAPVLNITTTASIYGLAIR